MPINTYNLHKKVEILIELQLGDDGILLNGFSSQQALCQSSSRPLSDAKSDIEFNIDVVMKVSTREGTKSE